MASDLPKRKLVIPPGFAHCALSFQAAYDTDPWYITFGSETTVGTGIANTIYDLCTTQLAPVLDNNITMTGMRVRNSTEVDEHLESVVGGAAGSTLPSNCAVLVKKTTNKVGKQHRGRWYLPGVHPASDVTEAGVLATVKVTALQAKMTALLGTLTSAGVDMYILHTELETEPGTAPAPTQVTGLSVSTLIATQRRRMR